jgi:RNA polymerase sigma-70 factor (ECF subfamily)
MAIGRTPEGKTQHFEGVPTAPEETLQPKDNAQLPEENGVDRDVSSVALESAILGAQNAELAATPSLRPSGELDDTALMLRVQAGDDSAFDLLVERFRRPMVGFMYRMAHNQAIAEELAQEVFLRVYRSRQSYAAEAKFSTWLYRIATNLALNHVRDTRNERVHGGISLDEPDEDTGKPLDVADQHRSVEEDMLRRERMNAIRKQVESLPEKQRMAVIMHKYQEMDYREIAGALKMSESAVKSLLFRAYEALRVKLKDFV